MTASPNEQGNLFQSSSQNGGNLEENDDDSITFESEIFCLLSRPDILSEVIKSLSLLRKNEVLCDLTLKVEETSIKAHKIVLSASTPYFNAMFTNSMLESTLDEVVLKEVDPFAVEKLIDFIYGENLIIKVSNVYNLLSAASLLQITCVKDACINFLMKKLHPENCLTVRNLADVFSCSKLFDAADSFLEKNFLNVAQCEEFLQLNIEELTEVIKKDNLNVISEEQILETVLSWVKKECDDRKDLLPKLLCHVRLTLLSPQYLSDRVLSEEIIRENIECRDLIDKAKDYMLMPERRKLLRSEMTLPRRCSEAAGLIYIVGGLTSNGDSLSTVEKYDITTTKWTPVLPMAIQRSRVGVAILDGKLYAIGGFDGKVRLNHVERYDPSTNSWEKICPMNIRRSAVGAAVSGDKIYVVGGYDGHSSLNSVECYDPEMNQWKFVASMATLRSAAGVTALNGKLYCAGGHDGLTIFSSVEAYDSISRQWRLVASMSVRRCRLGLTVLNNRIYALGGYDGSSFLSTVEYYDVCNNQWMFVAPMLERRSRVSSITLGGNIFAVGGYNGTANLSTIESYDPWANEWKSETEMSMHDGGVGVGVLPRLT